MLSKQIKYFGEDAFIACDGRCDKAWGRSTRPKGDDGIGDRLLRPDSVLGTAPEDPGTYEGPDSKPLPHEEKLNRWCCRECERCALLTPLQFHDVQDKSFLLPTF